MTFGLKPYPALKDSGVPWMGEVPEHWALPPLKRWVHMNREVLSESTAKEHEFGYLDIGSVGNGGLTARPQPLRFGAAPSRARRIVLGGDTIVSTVRTYLRAVYFLERGKDSLICSTGFAVLTPRDQTDPKFVSYVCRSSVFTDRTTADSVGIAYPAIAETRLGSFHVAVPPLSEQIAIVRFLDLADRRIRRYIRAKQRLIKLLEEQKQAIIHRAVTRGLDPNVRLKPSGVEWLGDVPEHWEARQVRRVISLVTSGSRGWADYYSDEGDIFIQSGNLGRSMTLDFARTQHVTPPRGAEGLRTSVHRDDVLVCITGALTGNVAIVDVDLPCPAYVNQHVALMRPRCDVVLPRYLAYALCSEAGKSQFKTSEYGGTKQGLGLDDVKSALVLLPPIDEQREICSFLDTSLMNVQSASSAAQKESDLLREYRTRLIADVVTGKLDVLDAAAQLPDETDEYEPLDETEVESNGDDADAADTDTDGTPEESAA